MEKLDCVKYRHDLNTSNLEIQISGARLSGAAELALIGDSNQLPYIDRGNLLNISYCRRVCTLLSRYHIATRSTYVYFFTAKTMNQLDPHCIRIAR